LQAVVSFIAHPAVGCWTLQWWQANPEWVVAPPADSNIHFHRSVGVFRLRLLLLAAIGNTLSSALFENIATIVVSIRLAPF
jgi:hypothetical protein